MLILSAIPLASATADDIGFDQHLGAPLPNVTMLAEAPMRVAEVQGGRPLLLALGYYKCSNLCGIVRADLLSALQKIDLRAGQDYTLLVLSIDPAETAADAAQARSADLKRFPLPGDAEAIRYATASPASLKAIEAAVGYRAHWDARWQQFAHPAGLVVISPQGRIAEYIPGVGYKPDALRQSILRARAGVTAPPSFILSLPCFHFDPATGRYTLAVMVLVKAAGAITVLLIGSYLVFGFYRDRRL